jgi:hypothetical protein
MKRQLSDSEIRHLKNLGVSVGEIALKANLSIVRVYQILAAAKHQEVGQPMRGEKEVALEVHTEKPKLNRILSAPLVQRMKFKSKQPVSEPNQKSSQLDKYNNTALLMISSILQCWKDRGWEWEMTLSSRDGSLRFRAVIPGKAST